MGLLPSRRGGPPWSPCLCWITLQVPPPTESSIKTFPSLLGEPPSNLEPFVLEDNGISSTQTWEQTILNSFSSQSVVLAKWSPFTLTKRFSFLLKIFRMCFNLPWGHSTCLPGLMSLVSCPRVRTLISKLHTPGFAKYWPNGAPRCKFLLPVPVYTPSIPTPSKREASEIAASPFIL